MHTSVTSVAPVTLSSGRTVPPGDTRNFPIVVSLQYRAKTAARSLALSDFGSWRAYSGAPRGVHSSL